MKVLGERSEPDGLSSRRRIEPIQFPKLKRPPASDLPRRALLPPACRIAAEAAINAPAVPAIA